MATCKLSILGKKFFQMKNITLFACDNGLGHIRRTHFCQIYCQSSLRWIFYPKKKIKKFLKPSEAKIINLN